MRTSGMRAGTAAEVAVHVVRQRDGGTQFDVL